MTTQNLAQAATRPSEKKSSSNGLKTPRNVSLDHFVISQSGSTVRRQDGLTITWQYFRDTIARSSSLPRHGSKVSRRHIQCLRRERGISLSTRLRSSRKLTIHDLRAAKNLNSGVPVENLPSGIRGFHVWLAYILKELGRNSSKTEVTLSEACELLDAFTRSHPTCSTRYEPNSEYRDYTVSV